MSLFGRRADRREPPGDDPPPAGVLRLAPSASLARLLGEARRALEEGGPPRRALLLGAPSGTSIESLAGAGFRVSVDGEADPRPPLEFPGESFHLVLAFDLPDCLDDGEARELLGELVRLLHPGGVAWFLAGRDAGEGPRPPRRWDLAPDGGLAAREVRGPVREVRARSNRDLERLGGAVASLEIVVRRDGWREVLARRPAAARG